MRGFQTLMFRWVWNPVILKVLMLTHKPIIILVKEDGWYVGCSHGYINWALCPHTCGSKYNKEANDE
jgi:hypothetical protein